MYTGIQMCPFALQLAAGMLAVLCIPKTRGWDICGFDDCI